MMQFFRSIAKPLVLVIAIAFFAWLVLDLSGLSGGGGLLTRTSVGKVNGESVEIRAFQTAVEQAIQNRQRQTGASLTLEEAAQVRDQVWEETIQSIIFRDEYERHGLRVTAPEVAEAIRLSPLQELMESPSLQTDGKFDPAKYQRWLTTAEGQATVPLLEARYREEILRGKLLRRVLGDVYVSDAALWERYRDENEKARIGILTLDPAVAVADSAAPVSAKEIEDYYRAHRDDFRRSRAAFVSYLSLPRAPDASDTAAAYVRIRALRAEITRGTSFAEVARRESADTFSGRQGGDLGEQTTANMDPAFGRAVMSLPLNTISEPVLSSFGLHLIQVESRKGETFKARHILVPIEVTGAHREQLDQRADSLEELAAERLEPSALDTAASALRLPIRQFGPLSQGTPLTLPEAGRVPDVSVWAFQAKPGEESHVVEAERSYLVFRLDSVHAEGVPPLTAVRGEVEQRVRMEKKRAAAKQLAAQLAARVGPGTGLRELAQGPGTSYREVGPVSRYETGLPDPELIGASFGAPRDAVAGPVAVPSGVYLFETLERIPADSAEFVKTLPQLRERFLQAARQGRVRAYFAALRASARIVDRRAEVFTTSAQAAANAPVPIQY